MNEMTDGWGVIRPPSRLRLKDTMKHVILERKRLAEQHLRTAKKNARRVLEVIAQRPGLGDRQISILSGVSRQEVSEIRERYGIMSFVTFTGELPEGYEFWSQWCEEDNAKLDNGICEVNLHDEELKRYLEIREYKACNIRRNVHVGRIRKEQNDVCANGSECQCR